MKSEFDGNTKTGTFPMVDRVPRGRKPVSSKWCFGFKTDEKGKITKLKARLVGRGFTQIREVDYTHFSSPCPSSASVKLILAVANEKGLPLCQFRRSTGVYSWVPRRRGVHETRRRLR